MNLGHNVGQLAAALRDDAELIEAWLHNRSPRTQTAYRRDVTGFLAHLGKKLSEVTLDDIQNYADAIGHLAATTRARTFSAIKSLLTFGFRLGVLPVDVGHLFHLPLVKNNLSDRILSEDDVRGIIAAESNYRNRALVRLLYVAGLRVSEVCYLTWRDLRSRGKAGEIVVAPGTPEERVVLLSRATWQEVMSLREQSDPGPSAGEPVFRSQKGGHLHASSVWRIVRAAARRAGVDLPVSPHWLRHSHAVHALDQGAPLLLVQATLGHRSIATTERYLRRRPSGSSARYLEV
ncbi:MAG: tyrosine-type recombinase/integrase [Chloroflexota bacterium]